jgi:hypothetical protein
MSWAQIGYIRTAFTNACRRANLTGVRPYTLQGIFPSRLGMAVVNNRCFRNWDVGPITGEPTQKVVSLKVIEPEWRNWQTH